MSRWWCNTLVSNRHWYGQQTNVLITCSSGAWQLPSNHNANTLWQIETFISTLPSILSSGCNSIGWGWCDLDQNRLMTQEHTLSWKCVCALIRWLYVTLTYAHKCVLDREWCKMSQLVRTCHKSLYRNCRSDAVLGLFNRRSECVHVCKIIM